MISEIKDVKTTIIFIKKYFPNFIMGNDPYAKNFIYNLDDQIVGFISYSLIYERAELNYILVDEKYRRQKIGQKFLNYCFNDLKKNKVKSITLEVNVKNAAAIYFYLNYGFKIIGIRKKYYQNKDGYLMIRNVN